MPFLKSFFTIATTLLSTSTLADSFLLPEHKSADSSYVKSLNVPGLEALSKNRGTWVSLPPGTYSGSMTCVVKGEPMDIQVSIEAKGDPKALYIFTADEGCGFVTANRA